MTPLVHSSNLCQGVLRAGVLLALLAGWAAVAAGEVGDAPRPTVKSVAPMAEGPETARLRAIAAGKAAGGPGVIVFGPVVEPGVGAADGEFGMGCSDWLELAVGGQPALGQTPVYSEVKAALRELKLADTHGRLTPAQARQVAQATGAPYYVTGTLTVEEGAPAALPTVTAGTAAAAEVQPELTLRYTMYKAANGAVVAPPLTLRGAPAQIRDNLPRVGVAITQALGVNAVDIPDAVDGSANELCVSGGMVWHTISAAERRALIDLEDHVVTASLALLMPGAFPNTTDRDRVGKSATTLANTTDRLIVRVPRNALAREAAVEVDEDDMMPRRRIVQSLYHRFPGNYAFAEAEQYLALRAGDTAEARECAQAGVRDAPRNPRAWMSLASFYRDDAAALQGSGGKGSTPDRAARLKDLYAAQVFCAQQVVILDPQSEAGWLELSRAEYAAGDQPAAQEAFAAAEKFSNNRGALYCWGLKLFQLARGGDAATQARIASAAAQANYDTVLDATAAMDALRATGFSAQAKELGDRWIAVLSADAEREPTAAYWRAAQAHVYEHNGDLTNAVAQWKIAAELAPADASVRRSYGILLVQTKDYAAALTELRAALDRDPASGAAHEYCGLALLGLGRESEARMEWLKAVRAPDKRAAPEARALLARYPWRRK